MGCGGSRCVNEYLENHPKDNVGKQSDLETAISHIEELKKSSMTKIIKIAYHEKSKSLNIGDAQNWIIQATFADGKKESEIYNVWINSVGAYEVQLGSF